MDTERRITDALVAADDTTGRVPDGVWETKAELISRGLATLQQVDDDCPTCGGSGTLSVYGLFLNDDGRDERQRSLPEPDPKGKQ